MKVQCRARCLNRAHRSQLSPCRDSAAQREKHTARREMLAMADESSTNQHPQSGFERHVLFWCYRHSPVPIGNSVYHLYTGCVSIYDSVCLFDSCNQTQRPSFNTVASAGGAQIAGLFKGCSDIFLRIKVSRQPSLVLQL